MPIEQNIPTNYETEEGVIACLLFNWRNIAKIADRLRPAHFHDARIAEAAYHQAENRLQIAEEAIMAVALGGDLEGLTPFGTALDAYLAHCEQRRAEVAEGKSVGVKTGLTTIDALLGGFRPGTLNILAARTSIGKTSLALNIALTIAKQALSTQ